MGIPSELNHLPPLLVLCPRPPLPLTLSIVFYSLTGDVIVPILSSPRPLPLASASDSDPLLSTYSRAGDAAGRPLWPEHGCRRPLWGHERGHGGCVHPWLGCVWISPVLCLLGCAVARRTRMAHVTWRVHACITPPTYLHTHIQQRSAPPTSWRRAKRCPGSSFDDIRGLQGVKKATVAIPSSDGVGPAKVGRFVIWVGGTGT